ncbi:nitrile hydratase subunit beta [Pseudooceanicola onchidii]|uniref:nitrile hydratase subunit beta n=1 Tax=Pseudooceanicola onchidii TaxID=2562279 RepID=UPI0010AA2BF9|nr:nitrile hydratase subunit beta [Pseudooceanicola onchidii]
MNGPQDAGGRMGFGPVEAEVDEPVFHAPWERRALALNVAAGAAGQWTIDQSRHAREDCPPADYYSFSYYQIWMRALENMLVERGLATRDEIATGQMQQPLRAGITPLAGDRVADVLAAGFPYDRDPKGQAPAYPLGTRVRTRNLQPRGHIRLPSYCRGKVGEVTTIHGYHVFPDTSAEGDKSIAHWLYAVTFQARDLFGDRAAEGDTVCVDLWEPYLDAE